MIYDNQLDTAVLAENNYFQNDLPTYYTLNGVGDIGAHIAKKENDPLYGTTAIFFGDSTTAGSGDAAGGWPTWIYKRNLSMHCINCGVYGATFGSASAQWFDGADNQRAYRTRPITSLFRHIPTACMGKARKSRSAQSVNLIIL